MAEQRTQRTGRRVIVALEGIDRSGKTTQTELLRASLEAAGERVAVVSFPRYGSFFGRVVRELLDGNATTTAATVDARSMALWYALDRWQAMSGLDPAATVVLLNRYTLSNAVYQSCRVAEEDADGLFRWVIDLEYQQLGLQQPDLTVVLDVAADVSQARSHNVGQPGDRAESPDVYERSAGLLARARSRYLEAPRMLGGIEVIACTDADGTLADPMVVHAQVAALVAAHRS